MSLRRTSRKRAAKKAVSKATKKAATSAPPRRSLILIGGALTAVIAAVVAKRVLSGDGQSAPSPPEVDRVGTNGTPQGIQPPIPKESAASESPQ
jgi:hypothetical protein